MKFAFTYCHEITPYVRMTGRGKYVKKNAQRYIKSQEALHWELIRQFKAADLFLSNGFFKVSGKFVIAKREGIKDIDNLGKAVLDAAQGIIFDNDKQVKEVHWKKEAGNRDFAEIIFETIDSNNN